MSHETFIRFARLLVFVLLLLPPHVVLCRPGFQTRNLLVALSSEALGSATQGQMLKRGPCFNMGWVPKLQRALETASSRGAQGFSSGSPLFVSPQSRQGSSAQSSQVLRHPRSCPFAKLAKRACCKPVCGSRQWRDMQAPSGLEEVRFFADGRRCGDFLYRGWRLDGPAEHKKKTEAQIQFEKG